MNANKNSSEPYKIRLATRLYLLAASTLAGAVLVAVFWEFSKRHPGIILVLSGVAGEVICDWKNHSDFLEKLKQWFAVILVVGLVWELGEAAKLDSETAHSNERSKQLESTNLVLRGKVAALELKVEGRKITPQNEAIIVAALKRIPRVRTDHPIEIMMRSGGDAEIVKYAVRISRVLELGGITPTSLSEPVPNEKLSDGLLFVIRTNSPPSIKLIKEAFREGGIEMKESETDVWGGPPRDGDAAIFVGKDP